MSSDVRAFLVGVGPTTASALQALTERFTVAGMLRRAGTGRQSTTTRSLSLGRPQSPSSTT